jgi:hypothetical protein
MAFLSDSLMASGSFGWSLMRWLSQSDQQDLSLT